MNLALGRGKTSPVPVSRDKSYLRFLTNGAQSGKCSAHDPLIDRPRSRTLPRNSSHHFMSNEVVAAEMRERKIVSKKRTSVVTIVKGEDDA